MKTKRELAMLRKFLQDVPFFQKIAEKLSITAFNSLTKKISCEFIPARRTVFLKGTNKNFSKRISNKNFPPYDYLSPNVLISPSNHHQ